MASRKDIRVAIKSLLSSSVEQVTISQDKKASLCDVNVTKALWVVWGAKEAVLGNNLASGRIFRAGLPSPRGPTDHHLGLYIP